MTDTEMYTAETPPFTLIVTYTDESVYRVVVKHVDGRTREKLVGCTWEPRFGIDVADQAEINKVAEEMCVEMETK